MKKFVKIAVCLIMSAAFAVAAAMTVMADPGDEDPDIGGAAALADAKLDEDAEDEEDREPFEMERGELAGEEVVQTSQLIIRLGSEWAGTEFTYRTDMGEYPSPVTVDQAGVIVLEIGGSETYTLSRTIPTTSSTLPESLQADDSSAASEAEAGEEDPAVESDISSAPVQAETSGGVPILHIILFVGGLVVCVGALLVIQFMKKRGNNRYDAEFDDEDDDE